jgi:hypothetical protein
MRLVYWGIVAAGALYSFAYAFYLIKEKKKFSAVGLLFLGLLICGLSFFVRLK